MFKHEVFLLCTAPEDNSCEQRSKCCTVQTRRRWSSQR